MSTSRAAYPEKELIRQCLKGEARAQRQLYEQFAPKMFAVCLRYAKNRHNAEDILQEGFIKVYKYLKNFRGDGSFEGWMRRIFVNTAIEHYRKNSKVYSVQDIPVDYQETVVNPAIQNMSVDELLELVNRLSNGYRMVFNLYVMEGLNHREIAGELGISEGTSKSQLARARAQLQKMIAERELKEYGTAI